MEAFPTALIDLLAQDRKCCDYGTVLLQVWLRESVTKAEDLILVGTLSTSSGSRHSHLSVAFKRRKGPINGNAELN